MPASAPQKKPGAGRKTRPKLFAPAAAFPPIPNSAATYPLILNLLKDERISNPKTYAAKSSTTKRQPSNSSARLIWLQGVR